MQPILLTQSPLQATIPHHCSLWSVSALDSQFLKACHVASPVLTGKTPPQCSHTPANTHRHSHNYTCACTHIHRYVSCTYSLLIDTNIPTKSPTPFRHTHTDTGRDLPHKHTHASPHSHFHKLHAPPSLTNTLTPHHLPLTYTAAPSWTVRPSSTWEGPVVGN